MNKINFIIISTLTIFSGLASAAYTPEIKYTPIYYSGHIGSISNIIASKDGRYIASSSIRSHTVTLWSTKDQTLLKTFKIEVDYKAYGLIGPSAVSTDSDLYLPGVTAYVGIAFSKDSRFIAFGGNDRRIQIWNIEEETMHRTLKVGHTISSLSFHPEGELLAYSDDYINVRIIDINSGENAATLKHGGPTRPINLVQFDHSGKQLITVEQGEINIWDVAQQKVTNKIVFSGLVSSIALSPDDKYLAVSVYGGRGNTKFGVWDIQGAYANSVNRFHVVPTGDKWTPQRDVGLGVTFSTDGKYFAAGVEGYALNIWEVESGKRSKRIITRGKINSISFAKNNTEIVTVISKLTVSSWGIKGQGRIVLTGILKADALYKDKNYQLAYKEYSELAKQGNPPAVQRLGIMNLKGEGRPVNYEEALYWFEFGADNNYAASQAYFGYMLEHGKGIKVDIKRAKSLYKKAGSQGNSEAKDWLSNLTE